MIEEDDIFTLLENLKDKDHHIRIFTINTIVDNHLREEAVPDLIKLLLDDVAAVRSRAAWALGKIGDSSALDALIIALQDEDKEVRKNATRSIGEMMALDAIPELIAKLSDPSWEVRSEAAVVLEYMGWTPSTKQERILLLIAKEKWTDLLNFKEIDERVLLTFIKDPDKDVRRKIAWLLGQFKYHDAIEPLFDLLNEDESQEVLESVSVAIGKIGGSTAIHLLKQALKHSNWYVRKCSAAALGYTKDLTVIPVLRDLIDDDNRFISESAREAIQKLESENDK